MCEILAKENIKPIFLKGMASVFCYPEPLLRRIGDIDFLVLPEQFEDCCRVLEQNGYVKGIDAQRHVSFVKKRIEYECNRYLSANRSNIDKRADRIIYSGCKNCVTRVIYNKKYIK